MRHPKVIAGDRFSTKYGDAIVMEYFNANKITVKFIDTAYITTTTAGNVRSGSVNDKLHKSFLGVGFIGCGDNKTTINGIITKQYSIWAAMMTRCYSGKRADYAECSVCCDWHNFQTFADWFNDNYIDGHHLDKDIKINGNKIYNPEGCMFVTRSENNVKAGGREYNLSDPNGNIINIICMTEFCKGKDLLSTQMRRVAKGLAISHKGWTSAEIMD